MAMNPTDIYYEKLASRCLISQPSKAYSENGFKLWLFDEGKSKLLSEFFNRQLATTFSTNDSPPNYFSSSLSPEIEQVLNQQNQYFSAPAPSSISIKTIESIVKNLAIEIRGEIGYHFKVVNVRAWETKKNANFGPTDWHTDGTPNCIKKLLVYPNPMNLDNGTLEIEDHKGNAHTIMTNLPTIILADVGVLKHRGISPQIAETRPIIEVTIVPHPITKISYIYAGQNGRYPTPPLIS